MSVSIPIYRDHGERFQADACQPLLEAAGKTIQIEVLSRGHYPGRVLPTGVFPGLKMVGYWDARIAQSWGLPWHHNEGIEISYLETGALGFSCRDGGRQQDTILEAGNLIVLRPWQQHRIGCPNIAASRLHWLLIDVGVRRPHQEWKWPSWLLLSPRDIAELTTMLRHNEQPIWNATSDLRRCFQSLAHTLDARSLDGSVSRITIHINELLLYLLEMLRTRQIRLDHSLTSARRTVKLFLDELRTHPQQLAQQWNVSEMAQACGLGITQFTQHVKAIMNMTPLEFLTHRRMDLAAEFLCERNMGITETALECGFSSGQYFATVFGRHFGVSPREYRARYQNHRSPA